MPYITERVLSKFLALVLFASAAGCGKPAEKAAAPASLAVTSVKVVQKDVPVFKEYIGQTEGFQDIQIRARVEGYLETVDYKEGSQVKKGDLLYTIDPKTYEAALAQANARLAQTQSRFERTQTDVDRLKPLAESKAISQQEYDHARTSYDTAKAEIDAAKAEVEQATLNVGYTRVTSPIDGLIDVSAVKPGALVGRGENTLMTTISQMDPILVNISISEVDYLFFSKQRAEREKNGEAALERNIELILADGSIHAEPGKVERVERSINTQTGTLTIGITFANPNLILRPGQYAKVRAKTQILKDAILVPTKAVRDIQGMLSVAVVKEDNEVAFKTISKQDTINDFILIRDGVKPGETIVVDGLQKVRDGMTVNPTPAPEPAV